MDDKKLATELDRLYALIRLGKTDSELMREFHLNYATFSMRLKQVEQQGLRARLAVLLRRRERIGFRAWLAYRLELLVRSSLIIQFLFLIGLILTLALGGALLLTLFTPWEHFPSNLWWSYLRVSDPGYLDEDKDPIRRAISVAVSLGGWITFGLLISIITVAFQKQWERVEKGRSKVFVRDHSVILGWNPALFKLIDRLLDSSSKKRRKILVLSDQPAEELSQRILRWSGSASKSTVVCRTGIMDRISDLHMINLAFARELIILGPVLAGMPSSSGANVITTLCAVIKTFEQGSGQRWRVPKTGIGKVHCTLAVYEPNVAPVLRQLEKENQYLDIHIAEPEDFFSRIMAQSAMMPGIHLVMDELLTPGAGNSIFIKTLEELGLTEPTTFGELYVRWANIMPIGYYHGSDPGAPAIVNPDDDSVPLAPEDYLVFIASESLLEPAIAHFVHTGEVAPVAAEPLFPPLKVLVLGRDLKAQSVVRCLKKWLPRGSTIVHNSREIKSMFFSSEHDVSLVYRETGDAVPDRIELLYKEIGRAESPCDAVVLISPHQDPNEHDARILLETVAIRKMEEDRLQRTGTSWEKAHHTRVIGSFVSAERAELGDIAQLDVAVVEVDLLCNYLFRAVDHPRRIRVHRDLMKTEGSEPVLLSPDQLIEPVPGKTLRFRHMMETCRQKRVREAPVLCLGYLRKGEIHLNPMRSTTILEDDQIVCLADLFTPDPLGKDYTVF